jgi:hypothetical protein
MLRGDAALPFKDVVRNFDRFTESVINSILIFNRNFNAKPGIHGDFQPVARGATSLIAKEVLGIQLDQLASTLTDEEKRYVKFPALLRARVRVRDLDVEDIVMNDAECAAADSQAQQAAQTALQLQQGLTSATIRETLAAALKDLSQAGKNNAAAQATTANVILDALQKGMNPDSLSPEALANGNLPGSTGGPAAANGNGSGTAPASGAPGGSAGGAGGPGDGLAPAVVGTPAGGGQINAAAMPAG